MIKNLTINCEIFENEDLDRQEIFNKVIGFISDKGTCDYFSW